MRSLCFLVALMTVAFASPAIKSVEVNKRIIARLIGGGGDGALVGGVLGGDGGLIGDVLGGDSGLVGGLLGGKDGLLGNLLGTITNVVGSVLQTVLKLIDSLTSGLSGKTAEADTDSEFAKYPLEQVCSVCDRLPNPDHITACKQYCQKNNWTG